MYRLLPWAAAAGALLGQPAWATDCGTLYQLHARALVHGQPVGAEVEAQLSRCGGAATAPAPRPSSSQPALSGCDQVKRNHAQMLAMGTTDHRFDFVIAQCETQHGGSWFGGTSTGRDYRGARVTSGFGWRHHPILNRAKFHQGIDLDADLGDPVVALAAGVVTMAEWRGGYGNLVEIEHPLTGIRTRYGHNSQLLVRPGDVVREGQAIARAGTTGLSTGVHIHLEVRVGGQAVNPAPYLQNPDLLRR